MKKEIDNHIPYDPFEGATFDNGSVEQIVFENELNAREIKFFKKETINIKSIPYTDYSFAPEDLNAVKEILKNINKNRILVPEKKINVVTDFISTWFSRVFLVTVIAAIIFVIISYFKTKGDDEKRKQLEEKYQNRH